MYSNSEMVWNNQNTFSFKITVFQLVAYDFMTSSQWCKNFQIFYTAAF